MEECLPRGTAAVAGSIVKEWPMRVVLAKPARLPLNAATSVISRKTCPTLDNPRHDEPNVGLRAFAALWTLRRILVARFGLQDFNCLAHRLR